MTEHLLAKSPERGRLTLAEHTDHVAACVDRFAKAWGFERSLARSGAMLHDLGKGHPAAQAMLWETTYHADRRAFRRLARSWPWGPALEREILARTGVGTVHRHELSSLGFLPLFPEVQWPELVEMVAAHHKSVRSDKTGRGLLDLVSEIGLDATRDRHLSDWDLWAPTVIAAAAELGVDARPISRGDAAEAFDRAVEIVQGMPDGWSPWRGLLMSADHFGSAYAHDAAAKAAALFTDADVQAAYGPSGRYAPSDAYPLSQRHAEALDLRPHTLVVAPTGAGKTNFLFRRCRKRVFYTLPFQASINAMAERARNDLGHGADVRRLHAASGVEPADRGDDHEDVSLQKLPGAAVKVLTPHQLASVVFGTAGYEAVALDLRGQDVILDEVHTYGPLALPMVERLVRVAASLGCRVHVGTATVPQSLRDLLLSALGGDERVCEVRLTDAELDRYDRHTVEHVPDEAAARERITRAVDAGQRVLVVSNRVARAQERFAWAEETFPLVSRLLIHSRFRRTDRARLEAEVLDMAAGPGPCIVCATQVVEVSLDVSFDVLVTDAAPLDALVQRFGRVNRHARAGDPLKPVVVVAPPESDRDVLPYEAAVVRRSVEALPAGPLRERSLQGLISAVYPAVDAASIDLHLAHDADLRARLRRLEHRPRSVIVEALQIESETAIRASDRVAYARGPAAARVPLEIPAPESLGRVAAQNGWPRCERGSWPVVVPDEQYDALLGLQPLRRVEPADLSFADRSL